MGRAFPAIRQSACSRFRYRYSACRRCEDACPHAAVRLRDDGVELDEAACQNCTLCVSACRSGAITSVQVAPLDWVRRAAAEGALRFACPQGEGDDAVRVPCLGALDAATLSYLSRRGIMLALSGADRCSRCAHGTKGDAQLALNLDAVSALAAASGSPERWRPIELPECTDQAAEIRPGRRQLFRRLLGRGIDALADQPPGGEPQPVPEKAIRAGPYHLPELRELLNIVRRADAPGAGPVAAHAAIAAVELMIEAGCTQCEACFRACPTGALQIDESATHWSLAFEADRCVGCELCVEVCQPMVMHAADALPPPGRGPRTLHRLGKQRCQRCDRPFASAQPADQCPVCADDADVFDQIFS